MTTEYYRITVEDLTTGETASREIAGGDYMLIPTGTCYLDSSTRHANGTVQLTIKGHKPTGRPRPSSSADAR